LALTAIGFSRYNLFDSARMSMKTNRSSVIFGFFAGILGSAHHTPCPPIVIYGTLRKWSSESFRATMKSYFLVTGVLIIAAHGTAGLIIEEAFRYFLLSLPATVLAVVCGTPSTGQSRGGISTADSIVALICGEIRLLVRTLAR
jgi:hypothetical protein